MGTPLAEKGLWEALGVSWWEQLASLLETRWVQGHRLGSRRPVS